LILIKIWSMGRHRRLVATRLKPFAQRRIEIGIRGKKEPQAKSCLGFRGWFATTHDYRPSGGGVEDGVPPVAALRAMGETSASSYAGERSCCDWSAAAGGDDVGVCALAPATTTAMQARIIRNVVIFFIETLCTPARLFYAADSNGKTSALARMSFIDL
jgi:hypothetical protein